MQEIWGQGKQPAGGATGGQAGFQGSGTRYPRLESTRRCGGPQASAPSVPGDPVEAHPSAFVLAKPFDFFEVDDHIPPTRRLDGQELPTVNCANPRCSQKFSHLSAADGSASGSAVTASHCGTTQC